MFISFVGGVMKSVIVYLLTQFYFVDILFFIAVMAF